MFFSSTTHRFEIETSNKFTMSNLLTEIKTSRRKRFSQLTFYADFQNRKCMSDTFHEDQRQRFAHREASISQSGSSNT